MRFEQLTLENVRCFEDATIELDRGVTVVHGPNGSGKTTLLEAAFFALYGAQALDETLDQFMTSGATETEVRLSFVHDGTSYSVYRRLRRRDDRATTAECTLETGTETITGARAVEERISAMLRMDADAFVNCAYVRQGEINKLIHASPTTRQDIIDGLLQLGVLETYRERASAARLAVEDHLGELTGELAGLTDRIEAKEAKNLPARLNDLQTEQADVESDIERLETQLEAARTRRDEATDLLETFTEKQRRRDELAERIDDLEETIAETETERDELRERLRELRGHRESLEATRDQLRSAAGLETVTDTAVQSALDDARTERDALGEDRSEAALARQRHRDAAETAADRAAELAATADDRRAEAESLAEDIDAMEATIDNKAAALDELIDERTAKRDRFEAVDFGVGGAADALATVEAELTTVTEDLRDMRGQLEAVTDRVERGEALLAEDRCPECGQSLEGAPRHDALVDDREKRDELTTTVAALEQRREELETRRDRLEEYRDLERDIDHLTERIDTMRTLLEDRKATVADTRRRREELQSEADRLESEAEEAREEAAAKREAAAAVDETLDTIDESITAVEDRIETLTSLRETHQEYTTVGEEIEQVRERRSLLAEQNDERRQTLADLRTEYAELEEALDRDRIETARAEKARAEAYIEDHEPTLEEYRNRRDELQGQIGRVQAELDELDALRDQRATLQTRNERLEQYHEETASLETLYDELKTNLRLRNVQLLDDLLNETFDLIYYDKAYDRIELSEDYELTVYQRDGTSLDPEQLSGGERALFNLSLRSAIYRLLAEGIEGSAPMPPLILDEPTVFLDSEHVAQLVELIEAMRTLGVEQILVVSHDDELIDAAETLITVQKDATTNRSQVDAQGRPIQASD